MTCLLIAVLRVMSFTSMASIDMASWRLVKVDQSETSISSNKHQHGASVGYSDRAFFEKAMLVLFDFPQFCCISAYVLLIVLWAEAFVKVRRVSSAAAIHVY